jgi:hypothetical protein
MLGDDEKTVRIELKAHDVFRVPFMWLTYDSNVDVYLEKKEESKKTELLFENLSSIFNKDA